MPKKADRYREERVQMLVGLKQWWKKWCRLRTMLLVFPLVALLTVVVGGYIFDWSWAGFGLYVGPPHDLHSDFQRGKTLWDWMQLLIIPLVLALGALWFNWQQSRTEHEIATDRQREDILEAYLDRLSALLLDYHLRESNPGSQIREVAHVRTLTVLRKLDPDRKVTLLRFLQDGGLVFGEHAILDLNGADLTKVNLQSADLHGVNLSMANLSEANLRKADLSLVNMPGTSLSEADLRDANLVGADLRRANLCGANLIGADLHEANLDDANLQGAKVANDQLKKAASLKGASGFDNLNLSTETK